MYLFSQGFTFFYFNSLSVLLVDVGDCSYCTETRYRKPDCGDLCCSDLQLCLDDYCRTSCQTTTTTTPTKEGLMERYVCGWLFSGGKEKNNLRGFWHSKITSSLPTIQHFQTLRKHLEKWYKEKAISTQ